MEDIMVEKWNITIPELTGDEERRAYIYLPESYTNEPDKHYPVLYMFDGHNVFFDEDATYGKCWGMKEYMDYTQTQVIIAAVECNHSPDNGIKNTLLSPSAILNWEILPDSAKLQ